MPDVYVAVGSNIEPQMNIQTALSALKRRIGTFTASRAYRNASQGFEGPEFINMVIGFETELTLTEVLSILQAVEGLCGRPRKAPKFAPRTLDLDLLLYGDMTCSTPAVTLPRPDLIKRSYMLGPLAEIAPNRVHPTLKQTIGDLWKEFGQATHQLEPVVLA
ncbi:MAG TPA: 2-amino-4-hydroxy-6-hydroxymethyldihydropteridine diphosphokinase [Steroidobacteraceae bacterium]|nr:2-amino-4-hydroxy-6-hydroxymethyldihydropteridine diphosphokinase [Steroidobacteraceae bacterium]